MSFTPTRIPSTPELIEQREARAIVTRDISPNLVASESVEGVMAEVNQVVGERLSNEQSVNTESAPDTNHALDTEVSVMTRELPDNCPTTPANSSLGSGELPLTPGKDIEVSVSAVGGESTHAITPVDEGGDSETEINVRCPSRYSAVQEHLWGNPVEPTEEAIERMVKRAVEKRCNSDEPLNKRRKLNRGPSTRSQPTRDKPLPQVTYPMRSMASNVVLSQTSVNAYWKRMFEEFSNMNGWRDGRDFRNFEKVENALKTSGPHVALWQAYLVRTSFKSKCSKSKAVSITYGNMDKKKALAKIVKPTPINTDWGSDTSIIRGRDLDSIHTNNTCALCSSYGFYFNYFFGQRIVHPCPVLGALQEGDIGHHLQSEIVRMRKRHVGRLRVMARPVREYWVEFDMFNNVCYEDIDVFKKALSETDSGKFHDELALWVSRFEFTAADLSVNNGTAKAFKCNPLTRLALLLPPSDVLKIVRSAKYAPPASLKVHVDYFEQLSWAKDATRKLYYSGSPLTPRHVRVVFQNEEYFPGFPVTLELNESQFLVDWLF